MNKSSAALKIFTIALLASVISVATAADMVKDGSGNPIMYMGMEKKPMMDDKMDKKPMMDDKMDKMEKKPMMEDKMEKKMMDKKKM